MAKSTQKLVAALTASMLSLGLSGCGDVITGADHSKKKETAQTQEGQSQDKPQEAKEQNQKANDPVSAPDKDASKEADGDKGPSVSTPPTVSGAFGEKPLITAGSGDEATKLDIKVITEGTGKEIKPGDTVKVNYEGVTWDGQVFDSSFQRGEPIEFGLNQVIDGWKNGLPGHKVGSRVLMIIPPDQAYGPAGAGHQLSGKTLTFVVDILDTKASS